MRRFLFIIGLLALILFLFWQFPYAAQSEGEKMRIGYYALLLVVICGGSMAGRIGNGHGQIRLSAAMKYAAIWLAIVMALLVGYSFRGVLSNNRLMAELMPQRVQVGADGRLQVMRAQDGHFHIEGEVNGALMRFMIDTGASDIALSPADAARAGYDMAALRYTRSYSTANGFGSGAPVTLHTLKVGTVMMQDVLAAVNKGGLDESLLGMSFLNRFSSYQVEGDRLTLTP